ncbi:hypothetical protein EXIGLDRAFT_365640 [Exidia glandulosa HHB12029]|uniref:Uncharacterized protein n=1 Tax=Exidia glandulosa HHB12029 TaxID=1314781 RepID=A0A165L626_EXIGL|nr:hypothetical protein EXIGLDRAFT_365640 [Exidia glandulosa HHB12029]
MYAYAYGSIRICRMLQLIFFSNFFSIHPLASLCLLQHTTFVHSTMSIAISMLSRPRPATSVLQAWATSFFSGPMLDRGVCVATKECFFEPFFERQEYACMPRSTAENLPISACKGHLRYYEFRRRDVVVPNELENPS